jgi:ubiquinol-cytochrome c reductase cytochrome b subunit
MFYISSSALAFDSVEYVFRDVNNGWLFKYIHSNGASVMFIFLYIHISRGLYYCSYNYPRVYVWYSGLIIFILIMAISFFGYVLRWGQMSFWAAQVITSMFGSIRLLGNSIVEILWGGYSVDKRTLIRFFSLHFLLPFVVFGIMFIHIFLLHVNGSTNPIGVNSNGDKLSLHMYFSVKDAWGFVLVMLLICSLVFYYRNMLGHRDNYIYANSDLTRLHIVREWYFLRMYGALRSVTNKVIGLILMIGCILVLFLLRLINQIWAGSMSLGVLYRILFWFIVSVFCLLGLIGKLRIEYRWEVFGKILIVLYYLSICVLLPLSNYIELW